MPLILPQRKQSYREELAVGLLEFRNKNLLSKDLVLENGSLLALRRYESQVELRQQPGRADSIGTISGICAPYNSLSCDLGGFKEIYQKGCFTESLNSDICLFGYHDSTCILGRTSNGSLRFTDGLAGLAFEDDLPDTTAGRDLLTLVERRDVKGTSCGFLIREADWDNTAVGRVRTITKGQLLEISPVAMPAYPAASVQASTEQQKNELKLCEMKLRLLKIL
jgi:HK97 family phage prohead protease